jgi:hypothetical protein
MPIDLKGKTIVFTGALSSMTRNEAKGIAYKLGAKVSDSMGFNVDYLVVGDKPGSKLEQARRYSSLIIKEDEWYKIAGVRVYPPEVLKVPKKIQTVTLNNDFLSLSKKKSIPPKVNNDFPELDLD